MRDISRKLKRKLKASDTEERCGLVLQGGKVVTARNLHPKPEDGFMIDPKQLVDNEDDISATWHTHPGRPSVLSSEDYQGFRQWPALVHFIVGTDGVRAYRVTNGIIQEVPCD